MLVNKMVFFGDKSWLRGIKTGVKKKVSLSGATNILQKGWPPGGEQLQRPEPRPLLVPYNVQMVDTSVPWKGVDSS